MREISEMEKTNLRRQHPHANAVATVNYDARVTRPQAGATPGAHGTETKQVNCYAEVELRISICGAGLLANMVGQSILMLNEIPHSRASPLPHFVQRRFKKCVRYLRL